MTTFLPLVIGITGRARAGKSTAAEHMIANHGFQRVRFAGKLKEMIAVLGLTPSEIEGEFKETPCSAIGDHTPRYAMQTLGTEWGRHYMGENFWVKLWRREVLYTKPGRLIVADDVRFDNEADAIRQMGGKIIRITRGPEQEAKHESERGAFPVDMTIRNDNLMSGFKMLIDTYIGRYVTQDMVDRSWAEAAIEDHPISVTMLTGTKPRLDTRESYGVVQRDSGDETTAS